ncbi:hypothetical protein ACOME3_002080 [Neoechinorhynchus agilis]
MLLDEKGVNLKLEKCQLMQTRVAYIGHILEDDWVRSDETKGPDERCNPKEQNRVKMFPRDGYISGEICATFTKDVSTFVRAIKKRHLLDLDKNRNEAFKKVKAVMSKAQKAIPFDPNLPVIIRSDASNQGYGAALFQSHEGVARPIIFASRLLDEVQVSEDQRGLMPGKAQLTRAVALEFYPNPEVGHEYSVLHRTLFA